MKITDLTQQKKKGRISVFLDGEFACSLDELTVLSCRLKVGDEISAEQLDEIRLQSDRQTASDKAMAYAARGAHSEKRMRDYLSQKGYGDDVIDEVIEKLKYYDYINDERLAFDFVSYYAELRGINRIRQDLQKMGIDEAIIYEALRQIDDQYDACKRYGEKYMRSHKEPDKIKASQHLASKGFCYDLIRRVVNELFDSRE